MRISSLTLLALTGMLAACTTSTPTAPTTFSTVTPTVLLATPTRTPFPTRTAAPTRTPAPKAQLVTELGLGTAKDAAWSPDGKWIAVAGSLGVHLHQADTLTVEQVLSASGAVGGYSFLSSDVAFSPDSQVVVNLANEGLTFWDLTTGRSWVAPQSGIESVFIDFAPDGKKLAILTSYFGLRQAYYSLQLLETQTGKTLFTLFDSTNQSLTQPMFSPDGEWVVAGDQAGVIQVWSVTTGRLVHTLNGHIGSVQTVIFSPDGKTLFSGGVDATLRVWDITTWQATNTLADFMDTVQQLIINPADGTLWVWVGDEWQVRDATTLELLRTVSGFNRIKSFSPDGKQVLSDFSLYETQTGTQLRALEGYAPTPDTFEVSPDGRTILTNLYGRLSVWEVTEQRIRQTWTFSSTPHSGFSPDSARFVVAVGAQVSVWDTSTFQRLWQTTTPVLNISAVSFSPDGRSIALGGFEQALLIEATNGGIQRTLKFPSQLTIQQIVFRPDGQGLLAGLGQFNSTTEIYSWDFATDTVEEFAPWGFASNTISQITLSPNGHRLALTFWDDQDDRRRTQLWDIDQSQLLHQANGNEPLTFSPDERFTADSNNIRITLREVTSGEMLYTLRVKERGITKLAFDQSGNTLFAITAQGTVMIWDFSQIQAMLGVRAIPTPKPIAVQPTSTPLPSATALPSLALTAVPLLTADAQAIGPTNAQWLTSTHQLGWGTFNRAALSPNGQQLALGGLTGVDLYDANSLRHLRHIDTPQQVDCLRFSPDGHWLVAGAGNGYTSSDWKTVWRWDTTTGERGSDLPDCPQYSRDGQRLTYNQNTKQVVVDAATEQVITTLNGASQVTLSPDHRFAVGQVGNVLRVWGADTARITHTLPLTLWLQTLAFSPQGLLAYSTANSVLLARVDTGQVVSTIELGTWDEDTEYYTDIANTLAFSSDGRWLATGSYNGVRLWEVSTGTERWAITQSATDLFFSPDGSRLYVIGRDSLSVHSARSGQQVNQLNGAVQRALGFNARNELITLSNDQLQWVNTTTGQTQRTSTVPDGTVIGLSPDGKSYAARTAPVQFEVRDLNTHRPAQQFQGAMQSIYGRSSEDMTSYNHVVFSPDQQTLATVGTDTAVRFWDVASGQQRAQLGDVWEFGTGPIGFSPDGRWLAVSLWMDERSVFLLRSDTGSMVRQLSPDGASDSLTFAFHPNGLKLAVTGDGVEIWDLETAQVQQRILTSATALAYSPDGSLLATGDKPNTLTIWDANTGEALVTLNGHQANITQLQFSPDGHTLVSTSADGTTRLWQVLGP